MSSPELRRSGRSFTRKTLSRVAAFLLGLSLATLAAEAIVRVEFGWPQPAESLVFDRELGHRMRSGTVSARDDRGVFEDHSNAHGFRSRPMPSGPGAPSDPPRLLVLGDSFVRAWEIRDGERFSERAVEFVGSKWEAHHVCADDWGTAQELLALREYGARIAPERVVLTLFPGNDLINVARAFAGRSPFSPSDWVRPYVEEAPGGAERVRYAQPVRAFLRRRSALLAQLETRALRAGWLAELARDEPRGSDDPWKLHECVLVPPELNPDGASDWESAWSTLEFLIAAVRDECDRLGARLVVVVLPTLFQVQTCGHAASARAARLLDGKPCFLDASDFEYPERRLAEFFARSGIEGIQTLDALRAAARASEDGVYLIDGHLNAEGHAAVGAELARWLRDEPTSAPVPASSGPVDLLPRGAEAVTWIDFDAGPQARFLHLGLTPRWPSGSFGATERVRVVKEATVAFVVRADRRPLGVRGFAEAGGSFPCTVRLHCLGEELGSADIEGPGPFELVFENRYAHLLAGGDPSTWPYLEFQLLFPVKDRPPIGIAGMGVLPDRAR